MKLSDLLKPKESISGAYAPGGFFNPQAGPLANKVLQTILADGYDIDDPDTYVQLDRKLKREMPPPGTGPDRGNVTEGGSFTFTAGEKQKMIDWGLDPADPKHRAEWVKTKKRMSANG